MINVLVPTDFSVASLALIDQTAKVLNEKLNIYLFHAFEIQQGKEALQNRQIIQNKLITETLRQRCRRIKANNKNISNISVKIMHGSNQIAFSNFTDIHKIDLLVLPHSYTFIAPSKESVNPVKLFKKSGIEKLTKLMSPVHKEMNTVNTDTHI